MINPNHFEAEFKFITDLLHHKINNFFKETKSYLKKYNYSVDAIQAFHQKTAENSERFIAKANNTLEDISRKIEQAYDMQEKQRQLQMMADDSLDAIANIGFEYTSTFDDFHKLQFENMEKQVVANNLVLSMLPNESKKENELEVKIKQIHEIKGFLNHWQMLPRRKHV